MHLLTWPHCSPSTPGAATHDHHPWRGSTIPTFSLGLFSPCFCGSLAKKLKLGGGQVHDFNQVEWEAEFQVPSPIIIPSLEKTPSLKGFGSSDERQGSLTSHTSVTALVSSRVTLAIRIQCSLTLDSRCPCQYFITLYEHNHLFYSSNSHYNFSLFNKFTWNSYGFLIYFLLMTAKHLKGQ